MGGLDGLFATFTPNERAYGERLAERRPVMVHSGVRRDLPTHGGQTRFGTTITSPANVFIGAWAPDQATVDHALAHEGRHYLQHDMLPGVDPRWVRDVHQALRDLPMWDRWGVAARHPDAGAAFSTPVRDADGYRDESGRTVVPRFVDEYMAMAAEPHGLSSLLTEVPTSPRLRQLRDELDSWALFFNEGP